MIQVVAAALLVTGNVQTARPQCIGKLLLSPRDSPRDLVKRHIAEGAYAQADAELVRLLFITPDDHELIVLQALNLFHENKYAEARHVVSQLVASKAATAEVRVLSGLLFVVANDLASAKAEFSLAVDDDSNNAAAHYYLGRALYMTQAIDLSVIEFKRTIALDLNFIQAYDALGLAYFVKEDTAEAQIWFTRGMRQEEVRGGRKLEWLRLDLATMLLTYHKSQEAAAYLAEAEQINATNPQVYLELGHMYFQERRYSDAIAAYAHVLKLDPSDAPAHYFRGRAYHFLKKDELAKEDFALFVALNQQHFVSPGSSVASSTTIRSKSQIELTR